MDIEKRLQVSSSRSARILPNTLVDNGIGEPAERGKILPSRMLLLKEKKVVVGFSERQFLNLGMSSDVRRDSLDTTGTAASGAQLRSFIGRAAIRLDCSICRAMF